MNDLSEIFNAIKTRLKEYQPPLVAKMDDDSHYDLWTDKPVIIAGRKRKEVYFSGLIIQKGYVGFYYMPVYAEPEVKKLFEPELLSLLKGKSCFHLKKLDERLTGQIEAALKRGYECYQNNGWV